MTREPSETDEIVPSAQVLAWGFLFAFLLLTSIARSLYAARGVAPSAQFEVLALLGFVTFVWYWVTQECKGCGASFPVDFAWFVSILWFVLVPYYMWRFQRWRGLIKCLVVSAWYIGVRTIGLAVYYAVAGRS